MAVMRSLCDTEKLFFRDRTGRDCFVTNFYLPFVPFTHDLRMLTLPFAANVTLRVVGNIFLKSSLVRSLEIVMNIQLANFYNLRFRFVLI
jgi:hypothetical protein